MSLKLQIMNDLIDSLDFKDIHWKTQDSNKESLLFYKLNDSDDKSYDLFLKNIQECEYKHLFVSTSKDYQSSEKHSFISFDEWSSIQEYACNKIFKHPKKSKIIAVTGTNGKTTTVDFIRQICVEKKVSVLSIGTLGVWHNKVKQDDFGLTTPNYIDLRKYIQKYEADLIVFEASSHAIEQKRFLNIKIDSAAWTSFSQDHLDYHKTMKAYYNAKMGLANSLKENKKMFYHPLDSDQYKRTERFIASDIDINSNKEFLKISYNKKNLDLAVSCLKEIGIDPLGNYEFLKPAPGRFNTYNYKDSIIIIDYAHTPDAIKNICKESKKSFGKNIVTVFGCGGNRDKTKRPLMGVAACENSNEVIITTDNPRFERPNEILSDITNGLDAYSNFEVIEDREDAIKRACEKENSLILILGKGHEAYMDIKGVKTQYSDIELIERIINE